MKPDCKLGMGYNANMLISDIYKKGPEYLKIVYNTYNLTEEVKSVIEYYLGETKEQDMVNFEKTNYLDDEKTFVDCPNCGEIKYSAIGIPPVAIAPNPVPSECPSCGCKYLNSSYMLQKIKENKKMAKIKTDTVETKKVEPQKSLNLLEKINAIRLAWSQQQIDKEGKGKAGGGSKYDYYKPQQIIDFCLAQELKHELFSEFKVDEGMCYYNVLNIATGEIRSTNCPFDIPRKMAASEAQQVGAAMTYHNRRLAMMMYKIEDNSKENVDVLDNADFSTPNIPAPPIVIPPPVATAFVLPPHVDNKIEAEQVQMDKATNAQIDELIHQQEINAQEENLKPIIPPTAPPTQIIPPVAPPVPKNVFGQPLPPEAQVAAKPIAQPTTEQAPPVANKNNIEALYD